MSSGVAYCLGWIPVLAAFSLAGCAMPNFGKQPVKADGPPPPQCTVEYKPVSGKPSAANVNLTENDTVSQVVKRVGADRKYSRMKISLQRQLPSGQWHNMDVKTQGSKFDALHDYHVQAGDRVVVSEDSSDLFDDMMTSSLGSLGRSRK